MQSNGMTIRQLDFTPMDAFISHVLEAFRADATRAARVFPVHSMVVLSFCDRVANDVVGTCESCLTSTDVCRLETISNRCSGKPESSHKTSSFRQHLRLSFKPGSLST
jgi:hypothetical protein